MFSQSNLFLRLRELKNYEFLGYLGKDANDIHIVRLRIKEFAKRGVSYNLCVFDFKVKEDVGKLSAVNEEFNIIIKELT